MTYDEIRAELGEMNPDAIMFEQPAYESALIGYTSDLRAVYDREKCIEYLVDEHTSHDDAVEFFEFNTLRAIPYMGEHAPVIFMNRTEA